MPIKVQLVYKNNGEKDMDAIPVEERTIYEREPLQRETIWAGWNFIDSGYQPQTLPVRLKVVSGDILLVHYDYPWYGEKYKILRKDEINNSDPENNEPKFLITKGMNFLQKLSYPQLNTSETEVYTRIYWSPSKER